MSEYSDTVVSLVFVDSDGDLQAIEFLDIVLLAAHVAEQQLKRNNYVITEGSVLLSPSTVRHETGRGNEYPIRDDSGSQIREASAEDLALLGSRD